MKWFDSHAHLQDEVFDDDRSTVLQRAREVGVTRILLPASDLEDARKACELAVDEPMIYVAIGVHPHEAISWEEGTASQLHDLLDKTNRHALENGRDAPVVAIGEIGLDFHYDFSPRDIQHQVFESQLQLAYELELPVVIHLRDATKDMIDVLTRAHAAGLFSDDYPSGVLHCYSESKDKLKIFLDMGFMIGFDGPITYSNAKKAREAIAAVPDDRLILETDAPWLSPRQKRGRRNEPSYLPWIGEEAAKLRGVSTEILALQTFNNACRLFRLSC